VLALGEDGTLEAGDIFDADAEEFGDLRCGESGSDLSLDVARTGRETVTGRFGLACGTPQLSLQHVVDCQREPCAGLGREHEDSCFCADDGDVFHANAPLMGVRSWCHEGPAVTGNTLGAPRVWSIDRSGIC
jgi:hypothetical protein